MHGKRNREREKRGDRRKAVSTRDVGGWPTAKAGSIRDDRPLKIAAIQSEKERERGRETEHDICSLIFEKYRAKTYLIIYARVINSANTPRTIEGALA